MDKLKVYEDAAGEWRWRKVAGNGETVADSGEGYTRKEDAVKAAWREADPEKAGVVVVETIEKEEEGT